MAAAKDKTKTVFVCSECGDDQPKWSGQCPSCKAWNTMVEAPKGPAAAGPRKPGASVGARSGYAGAATASRRADTLDEVAAGDLLRIDTGMAELNRVLGGGLVEGGVVLLSGDPGAGKSTLLIQTMCHIAKERPALYVTGEESPGQVKDRALRLALPTDRARLASMTDVLEIEALIDAERPAVVVVDSIQTVYHPDIPSAPGGAAQVRECASYLTQLAKRKEGWFALILVGHMTKDNLVAGPRALEHIVDAVLMLSSNDDERYRIVRAEKNRFGSTSEVGIFAMTGAGLREVRNPSAIFLSRSIADAPGAVATAMWEGTRPLLVEVQSLVDESALGNPRRVAVGIDNNRLAMLLAVLHRHIGLDVHTQDVYVNVSGGVKIAETSGDLAVLLAAVSSFRNRAIPQDVVAFGEIGLSGEVRPCANGQDRLREAAKLGFAKAVVPAANVPREPIEGMEVVPVRTLREAMDWLEGR